MADKQTLAQFGQSIKAKHPEYKDMDDAALGKAVLAKYPQYADMVSDDAATALSPAAAPPKEGLLESLGHTFGIGKEEDAQRMADFKEHPIRSLAMSALGPAGAMASGLVGGVKRISGEIGEAENESKEGNPYGAAEHAAYALPLVGEGIKRGVEQLGPNELINRGEVGTAIGTAAQAAPALMGAVDEAFPGRPTLSPSSIRSAAIGDPNAAALRGLRVPQGSPKVLSTVRSVEGARPFLQGANSLEDLQSRIPAAKNEIWGKYQGTVDKLADKPVQGPDGQTTVGDLESERQQLSALNRGLKKGSPDALQLAQQKGMTQAQLLDRERAVQGALDPHLEEAGIDPKLIRQTFGQVADVGSRVAGKSTITEPTKPYGFAKLGDLSLTKPLSNISTLGGAARDVAAGRYWSASPTDVGIREGFRTGGAKPDFRAPISGQPAWQNAPRLLESDVPGNAGYGDVDAGSMAGTPHPGPQTGTPPPTRLALPSSTGAGTAQPMIRYATPYAEPYDPGLVPFSKPEYLAPPKPYQPPLTTKPLLPTQGAQ